MREMEREEADLAARKYDVVAKPKPSSAVLPIPMFNRPLRFADSIHHQNHRGFRFPELKEDEIQRKKNGKEESGLVEEKVTKEISVEMCQNPNPSYGPNPDGLPSPSNPKEDREVKRQVQVKELALVLANGDAAVRVQAARDIRKIVRGSPKGRSAFAVPAIIQPLVAMLQSADHVSRESALLALLNMAVRNEQNKEKIVSSGAVPLLVEILRSNNTLRELATAAILTLSASKSSKSTIAASGAIPLLVNILTSGSIQGRVDAVTALYNLSDCCKNGDDHFISVDAVFPLLALLKDSKKYSKFADKATALLAILSESEEGRCAISEVKGGILTIVETVEEGSLRSTEHAVSILLSLCRSNREKYRELILNEGPIPGLLLLTVEGTKKACNLSHDLLKLLRHDSQSEKVESEGFETIVYSIATRVNGAYKAEETATRLLQDMVRRNMEENINNLQFSAATSSPNHS